jgi:hypothetical protein
MNTHQILTIIALSLLGLCLLCSLVKMSSKNDAMKQACNHICSFLVIIATIFLAVTQLINEENFTNEISLESSVDETSQNCDFLTCNPCPTCCQPATPNARHTWNFTIVSQNIIANKGASVRQNGEHGTSVAILMTTLTGDSTSFSIYGTEYNPFVDDHDLFIDGNIIVKASSIQAVNNCNLTLYPPLGNSGCPIGCGAYDNDAGMCCGGL